MFVYYIYVWTLSVIRVGPTLIFVVGVLAKYLIYLGTLFGIWFSNYFFCTKAPYPSVYIPVTGRNDHSALATIGHYISIGVLVWMVLGGLYLYIVTIRSRFYVEDFTSSEAFKFYYGLDQDGRFGEWKRIFLYSILFHYVVLGPIIIGLYLLLYRFIFYCLGPFYTPWMGIHSLVLNILWGTFSAALKGNLIPLLPLLGASLGLSTVTLIIVLVVSYLVGWYTPESLRQFYPALTFWVPTYLEAVASRSGGRNGGYDNASTASPRGAITQGGPVTPTGNSPVKTSPRG